MKIYLQLKSWQDLIAYYPILQYVPRQLKLVVARLWLKPQRINWENGPQLYLLPVSTEASYSYDLENALVLPQNNKGASRLMEALLVEFLPHLAQNAQLDFSQDTLLLSGLDLSADARFIKQLIKPWRYIIITGSNKLKLKWWKEFVISEAGQVVQFRNEVTKVQASCVCNFDPEYELADFKQPAIYVSSRPVFNIVCCSKTYDVFKMNIAKDYPPILQDIYGDFLPVALVEEWLKTSGIYHQRMSKWVDIIRLKLGSIAVNTDNDQIIYLKVT